jgi:hypothetical protein
MTGFWAQRLQAASAPPAAPPAPPGNTPWWMPQAPAPAPQQPTQPAPAALPGPPQQASVAPTGEVPIGDLLRQDGYTTEKAQSARDGEGCPSCGSPNYMHIGGLQSRAKRCFECGYNPMFEHSTAGASGIGQNIPVKSARVQTGGESHFNPQMIVGRV